MGEKNCTHLGSKNPLSGRGIFCCGSTVCPKFLDGLVLFSVTPPAHPSYPPTHLPTAWESFKNIRSRQGGSSLPGLLIDMRGNFLANLSAVLPINTSAYCLKYIQHFISYCMTRLMPSSVSVTSSGSFGGDASLPFEHFNYC